MPTILTEQNQESRTLFRPLDAVPLAPQQGDESARDIAWALAEFAVRREAYGLYHDYLNGNHRLTFATKGYREAFKNLLAGLRCNLCPRVVHALTDRLKVTGFAPHDAEARRDGEAEHAAHRAEADAAWALWQDGRLDRHENRIYTEAVAAGDAYLLVWPDPLDEHLPRFYVQAADQVVARYDPERPDVPSLAAKLWREGKRFRLNLYYPDRIEKYTTAERADGTVPDKPDAFLQHTIGGEEWPAENSYGRVPVFHFPFEGGIGQRGKAELRDIIPLQDALNKALSDLVIAGEFGAFRQKYAIGVSADEDDETAIQMGINRLMTVGNPDVKLGEFSATDLQPYIEIIMAYAKLMAFVKGLPLHTLTMLGDAPSGESLKVAEAPLVSRVEDTQTDFGDVWEDAMAFALRIKDDTTDAHLSAVWRSPVSRAEKETVEVVAIKRERAGISWKQAMRELGYSEDEIAQMEREREAEGVAAVNALDDALNREGAALDRALGAGDGGVG